MIEIKKATSTPTPLPEKKNQIQGKASKPTHHENYNDT